MQRLPHGVHQPFAGPLAPCVPVEEPQWGWNGERRLTPSVSDPGGYGAFVSPRIACSGGTARSAVYFFAGTTSAIPWPATPCSARDASMHFSPNRGGRNTHRDRNHPPPAEPMKRESTGPSHSAPHATRKEEG